jgi:bifunctional enzyme CysN/CysC
VRLLPSGRESTVARIVTADGDLGQAVADQSVTLVLADEIDVSRGDVICAAEPPAEVAGGPRASAARGGARNAPERARRCRR